MAAPAADYKKVGADALVALRGLLDKKDWAAQGEKNGVKIFNRYDAGAPLPTVMGVGMVDATAPQICAMLWQIENRGKYDPMFKAGKVLERVDDHVTLLWSQFIVQWPVTDRDFVSVTSWEKEQDGSYLMACKSCEHAGTPAKSSPVRGEILEAGFRIKPVGENKCELTWTVHTDPKGSIPSFVVSFAANSQAMLVEGVAKMAKSTKLADLDVKVFA